MAKNSIYQRDYMANHPKSREKAVARNRNKAAENRVWINGFKSERGCQLCPERDYRCLDFHHLDPKDKSATVSKMYAYSKEAIMREIKKCVILCANCHRKLTERPLVGRL